jgi:hypothetical protein
MREIEEVVTKETRVLFNQNEQQPSTFTLLTWEKFKLWNGDDGLSSSEIIAFMMK